MSGSVSLFCTPQEESLCARRAFDPLGLVYTRDPDVPPDQRYMGFTGIVGHEFVGVVEKVEPHADGDGEDGSHPPADFLVGKRVVGDINLGAWVGQNRPVQKKFIAQPPPRLI